jgi:alcohol dehydrogenase (cytochrome c)
MCLMRPLSAELCCVVWLAFGLPLAARAQSSYTTEQAGAGAQVYATYCATCHGPDLEGGVGPALAGARFLHTWSDRGARNLFTVLRTSMPRPGAGSLSARAYADVFAYILSRNGLPAGSQSFDGSAAMLDAIDLHPLAAAAGPAPATPPPFIRGERAMPLGTGPSQAELLEPDSADWLYHTGNYAGTRYSRLSQITSFNVRRLQVVCAYQLGVLETFYAGPIVYRGTIYVSTSGVTVALDAATCHERWRHTWEPKDKALWPNNRGVAIKEGYVVRGTADGYLVALDAADGKLLWARQVAKPDSGETITMPPLIYQELVIIGPAGSENNVQGWIGAFRLADGTPVWRFNTVPRPGEPGAETWRRVPGVPSGGGAVWTPLSLDVGRGELYVGVTNPAPDLPAHLRAGEDLYTNAVVALDVRTGRLHWYDQLVPSDFHDWDLTQVSPLIRANVAGVERDLIITSGKDGLLHALDRETHARLYETPVTTRRNVDAPLTREGTVACPGVLGGVEWNGPAYNPATGLLYVPAVDWCYKFSLAPDDSVHYTPGVLYIGGSVEAASDPRGWLTAVDARDGSVRWRYHSPLPMVAAVTTTAGGLVFTGEQTGDFVAFDAASGGELYRFYTGGGLFGGVATYAVNGRQYVAATSGGGSLTFGGSGSPTLFVFALPDAR